MMMYLSACSLAPPSKRPVMPMPSTYKESGNWVMHNPTLMEAKKKCPWWTLFDDPALNFLEERVTTGNQNLKLAVARYEEALALLQSARSELYPTVLAETGQSRQQTSHTIANAASISPTINTGNKYSFIYDTLTMGAYLNYEIDAWGMVHEAVATAAHSTVASRYDLAATDLSLHALLATTYFELRGYNEAQIALDRYVKAYEYALYLTHQLHIEGAVSAYAEDVMLNQLEHSKTAALDMRLKRAQLEHAIAVLVGQIPANFHLPPMKKSMHLVVVSPNLPSTLLQQRPDVAAAAQRVQAANSAIGVARAAFFPQFNLAALVGYQSKHLSSLFSTPSFIWSLGPPAGLTQVPPEVAQVLFDGYQLQAFLKKTRAGYHQAVDNYRQTVLVAFKEVEDSLVAVRRLEQEYRAQVAATQAAKDALYQAKQRWKIGIYTFLNVVNVEDNKLTAELSLINIRTRLQIADVQLIEALGGGWHQPKTPPEQKASFIDPPRYHLLSH